MTENEYRSMADMLLGARDVAVFCHISPDGDTLASALAVYRALTPRGISVSLYSEDGVPEKYKFLEGAELFTRAGKRVHELALAVDCSDIDRLGGGARAFLAAKKRAVIDHHKTHIKFAPSTLVDSDAAACAEIVYRVLDSAGLVDKSVAEALFVGIVTDTGCFRFSSTTAETHAIAADLMRRGIDAEALVCNSYSKTTRSIFALKQRVLGGCKFYDDGKIAVIAFRKKDFEETGTTTADTDGVIDPVIAIAGVEVAFSIAEVADKSFKISIRTGGGADASDIAAVFGGGGHSRAAGCRLNGYYEDIVDKLMKAARDRL